ncbi:unnamed protein product [Caenorhabditis sp. 36 PRJEB53466]|nr:unnamed protein product [Caenorhabditis sp. 36 PRJEB53466]
MLPSPEAAEPPFEKELTPSPVSLLMLKSPSLFIAAVSQLIWSLDFYTVLSVIGCFFVCSLYLLHIIALCYAKNHLYQPTKQDKNLPGVSVIKPIIGNDENLRENVESFFKTEYHKFELLFCFNNSKDPAVEVVKSLCEMYPKVSTRFFYKGEKVGLNPKINNMMPAYRAAKSPLIMISDSAIFIRPDGILNMAKTMMSHKKMALVTQTPYCKNRKGFAAAFEQMYFGTAHGRIYLAGNCMQFVCPTGMSSMIKKSALEECGGFAAFSNYLAEDYFFGRELANRGYKSGISTHPALQNSGEVTMETFMDRISRWVKLRAAMLPHIMLVEPIQDCFPSGIVMSMSLHYLFGLSFWLTYPAHCLFWINMDFSLMSCIWDYKMRYDSLHFTRIWLYRELLAPLVFFKAIMEPNIRWRNNIFTLAWGGKILRQENVPN